MTQTSRALNIASSCLMMLGILQVCTGGSVAAGEFDFYVLAQSWQPEFCNAQSVSGGPLVPGCASPHGFWRNHFTLHGLWPETWMGKHPSQCSSEPFDVHKLQQAIAKDDLVTFWPNVKLNESDPFHLYAKFWQHEWEKHGTCSGLALVEFFQTTIALLKATRDNLTPELVQQNVGRPIQVQALQAAFGGADQVALRCRDGVHLAEVRTCWTKDTQGRPVHQQACSASVLHENNCLDDTVVVRAF